jgi:aspartate kinase
LALLVQKYGGTSVADPDRIRNVARLVKRAVDQGHQVAVVVSAMAGTTNQLVKWVDELDAGHFDPAEYDTVVAAGEQITSGLLAIALNKLGVSARSFQGWQIPLVTEGGHAKARIGEIPADNLNKTLQQGHVAVISGFQGVSPEGRIATLGRGGSDTSAVPTSMASTRPIPGSATRRARSTGSPMRKCWSWPRSAPRCCRRARWRWPCSTR